MWSILWTKQHWYRILSGHLDIRVPISLHWYSMYFELFQKITNTMTLMDYPLFSWVVVIHSLHVSSFRELIIRSSLLPCTGSLWHTVWSFAVSLPFSYESGTEHVGEREGYSTVCQRLTVQGKVNCWWWAYRKLETCREWMTTNPKNKG